MKKNVMMRVAAFLLVCVLATTCGISGTFAKYVTSANAQDSARVAKWGVTVTATGNEAFAEKYDDTASATGAKVVSSVSGEDVLAPGTKGGLGSLDITGTPEVMVNVTIDVTTFTLTGWEIDDDNDPSTPEVEYCPIIFTIAGETYGTGDGVVTPENQSDDIADLIADITKVLEDLSKTNVAANTDLGTAYDFKIEWSWDFNTEGTGDYDKYDTMLGDLVTAPEIEFAFTVTVTQVD